MNVTVTLPYSDYEYLKSEKGYFEKWAYELANELQETKEAAEDTIRELNSQLEDAKVDGRDAAWWKASSDHWKDLYFNAAYERDELQAKLKTAEEDKEVLKDLLKETQDVLERALADNKRYLKDLQKAAEFIGNIPANTQSDNGKVAWDLWDETFRAYRPDNWANTNG